MAVNVLAATEIYECSNKFHINHKRITWPDVKNSVFLDKEVRSAGWNVWR